MPCAVHAICDACWEQQPAGYRVSLSRYSREYKEINSLLLLRKPFNCLMSMATKWAILMLPSVRNKLAQPTPSRYAEKLSETMGKGGRYLHQGHHLREDGIRGTGRGNHCLRSGSYQKNNLSPWALSLGCASKAIERTWRHSRSPSIITGNSFPHAYYAA